MTTKDQYNARIDALNTAADRILMAILCGGKRLSDCPRARERLAEIRQERDNLVIERNRKFKAVKIDESEVEQC